MIFVGINKFFSNVYYFIYATKIFFLCTLLLVYGLVLVSMLLLFCYYVFLYFNLGIAATYVSIEVGILCSDGRSFGFSAHESRHNIYVFLYSYLYIYPNLIGNSLIIILILFIFKYAYHTAILLYVLNSFIFASLSL